MKKMSKVLALVLTLAMIVGATLVTGVISTSADTEVTVWEGTIDMDFETKNTVAIINTDDTLTQAIRDDLAQNGAAVSYTLTSTGSYYKDGGPSGYTTWGFYDELTAATPDNYHEWWADKGSDMSRATWTDAADLALMGLKVNLCIYSDGTGDQAHVGTIKLVAVHSGNATPVTTQAPRPSVDPNTIEKQVLWTGSFDQDFVTSNTMAMLKNDEMNQAIRDDIAANGPAVAYVVEADAEFITGDDGYVSYCFYQETPEYLEAWADKGSTEKLAVWTNTSELAQMGNKVQLAFCSDGDGDTVHLNSLTIYVAHSGSFTVPSQSQTTPSASETTPSASESTPSQSESTPVVTDPSSTPAVTGDANGDGKFNMKDVLLLRKLLADIPVEIDAAAADVTGDGTVNMKDVLSMRKLLAAA